MAQKQQVKQVAPDVLPPEFNQWEAAPDTLPQDFNKFDAPASAPTPPQPVQEGGVTRFLRGAGLPATGDEWSHFLPYKDKDVPWEPGTLLKGIFNPQESSTAPAPTALGGGTPYSIQKIPLVGPAFRAMAETQAKPGAMSKVYSALPGVGPVGQQMGEDLESGNYAGATGGAANILSQFWGGKKADLPIAETAQDAIAPAVRGVASGTNAMLKKAPGTIGTAVGGAIGHEFGVPGWGAAAGYGLGKELIPKISVPGEQFGLGARAPSNPTFFNHLNSPGIEGEVVPRGVTQGAVMHDIPNLSVQPSPATPVNLLDKPAPMQTGLQGEFPVNPPRGMTQYSAQDMHDAGLTRPMDTPGRTLNPVRLPESPENLIQPGTAGRGIDAPIRTRPSLQEQAANGDWVAQGMIDARENAFRTQHAPPLSEAFTTPSGAYRPRGRGFGFSSAARNSPATKALSAAGDAELAARNAVQSAPEIIPPERPLNLTDSGNKQVSNLAKNRRQMGWDKPAGTVEGGFNSPPEALAALEQAAQQLFGKSYNDLSLAERLQTLSPGAKLQDVSRGRR